MLRNSLLLILCAVCAVLSNAQIICAQTFYGTTDLNEFRAGRDQEFRSKDESPLTETDFANYKGLQYFPTTEKYRVTANVIKTSGAKYFSMPTSSGNTAKYVKFGVLKFKLDGKDFSLNVYKWELPEGESFQKYKDLLLVPFLDLTNGAETYKVGRYLYINTPPGAEVVLDFNLAFNPSCAYGNSRYSCPIPPKDNFLSARIEAGEKSHSTWQKTEN